MITRARPKYFQLDMLEEKSLVKAPHDLTDTMYFSSGRAALKFFLINLTRTDQRKLRIGMQAFNCHVVAQAALEADFDIKLFDISSEYFSVTLASVQKHIDQIDVLLLTHYQGIPNFEYADIVACCRENGVLVIEDLSQSLGSSIDGQEVGSLGDASIFSFAFDKPLTSYIGGALILNNSLKKLSQNFQDAYKILPTESSFKARLHLRALAFFYHYSGPEFYHRGMNAYNVFLLLLWLRVPNAMIYFTSRCGFIGKINSVISRVLNCVNRRICIRKLHPEKRRVILMQKARYNCITSLPQFLQQECDQLNIAHLGRLNVKICWSSR